MFITFNGWKTNKAHKVNSKTSCSEYVCLRL